MKAGILALLVLALGFVHLENDKIAINKAYEKGTKENNDLAYKKGLLEGKLQAYEYLSKNKYSKPLVDNYCRKHVK